MREAIRRTLAALRLLDVLPMCRYFVSYMAERKSGITCCGRVIVTRADVIRGLEGIESIEDAIKAGNDDFEKVIVQSIARIG